MEPKETTRHCLQLIPQRQGCLPALVQPQCSTPSKKGIGSLGISKEFSGASCGALMLPSLMQLRLLPSLLLLLLLHRRPWPNSRGARRCCCCQLCLCRLHSCASRQ